MSRHPRSRFGPGPSTEAVKKVYESRTKHIGEWGDTANRQRKYMKKFGVSYSHIYRDMPRAFLEQLDACKDDSARRILLGISRKRVA